MNNGSWTLPITLGILGVILLYAVSVFNGLVRLRNRVRNAWAQIDVQLKTRADLIPNLVETVKGYAAHERGTFEEVVRARNQAVSAKTVQEAADANNSLTAALSRLMVVVEAYPQLKADQNFLSLQADLKDTEEKIRYSRQFYNDTVMKYNTDIEIFPKNIFAGIFNFRQEPLFKIAEEEKAVPKVQF